MQNVNSTTGNAIEHIDAVSATPQEAPGLQLPHVPQTAPQTAQPASVSIPQSAFAKLKEEQRRRGQREAREELEAKFKAHGFGSLDEALAALTRNGQTAAKATPERAQPEQRQPVREATTDDRQLRKMQQERERLAKEYAKEQTQRRKLQRQLEAKEAEMTLREAAVSHGVRDVDYALRLLQRELDGKSEADLQGFNEAEFFGKKLRSSHPYLFGEMVIPATTGTGVSAAPAPTAGAVQAATGSAGKFDARKATPAEMQAELRRRGLSSAGL